MRTYLIDAFNLFHKIRALENSTTPRGDLVHYIRSHGLTGSANNRVIIVFDGYETADAPAEAQYRIIFSDDRTADDIIKEKVAAARNKSTVIVVSDDLDIRNYAKSEGATVCRTQDFLQGGPKRKRARGDAERNLTPSQVMDINEELEKVWIK